MNYTIQHLFAFTTLEKWKILIEKQTLFKHNSDLLCGIVGPPLIHDRLVPDGLIYNIDWRFNYSKGGFRGFYSRTQFEFLFKGSWSSTLWYDWISLPIEKSWNSSWFSKIVCVKKQTGKITSWIVCQLLLQTYIFNREELQVKFQWVPDHQGMKGNKIS